MTRVLFSGNMEIEFLIRMLLACVLGILVGLERAKKYKAAGIRTYVIVAISAAVFTMVSKYGFLDVATEKTRVDVSRVAHTIVTGVSFLGAGIIFSKGKRLQGVTTAAGIWLMAAIGLACGSGMYIVAGVGTALVLLAQITLRKANIGKYTIDGKIVANMDDEVESLKEFESFLMDNKIEICGTHIKHQAEGKMTYTFRVRVSESLDIVEMSSMIAERTAVKSIDFYS